MLMIYQNIEIKISKLGFGHEVETQIDNES